jgi:polyphosphate glucokinase
MDERRIVRDRRWHHRELLLGTDDSDVTDQRTIAIGVDVGGSGIKAAAVDTTTGQLVSDRLRVVTPQPSTPAVVIESIARLVRRLGTVAKAPHAPVGMTMPSVVIAGETKTAANIDPAWVDFPAEEIAARAIGRPVLVINDADAAGIAEARFGAAKGRNGTVILLTLGTGVGSAIFIDGVLVPNTELGHMEIRGREAEKRSAAAARNRRGLSWKAWSADLDEHMVAIEKLFWPALFVIGGGVSKNADKFVPRLTVRAEVVPAALRNDAGIIGAALVGEDRSIAKSVASEVARADA